MIFINDRDLLLLDPTLFTDAQEIATLLYFSTDGSTSGTTLTSAAADFAAMEVDEGHVIVIGSDVLEITSRDSPTQLTVSRPRASADEPLIGPASGTGLTIAIPTFARLVDRIETRLLRSLGIDNDNPEPPLDESSIVNSEALASVVAAEIATLAFRVAAALDPNDASLAERAAMHEAAARIERQGARALIDLDDDGVADATRRPGSVTMRRV